MTSLPPTDDAETHPKRLKLDPIEAIEQDISALVSDYNMHLAQLVTIDKQSTEVTVKIGQRVEDLARLLVEGKREYVKICIEDYQLELIVPNDHEVMQEVLKESPKGMSVVYCRIAEITSKVAHDIVFGKCFVKGCIHNHVDQTEHLLIHLHEIGKMEADRKQEETSKGMDE